MANRNNQQADVQGNCSREDESRNSQNTGRRNIDQSQTESETAEEMDQPTSGRRDSERFSK